MMLQLDPPIPFLTDDGRHCTALLVLDYSPDYDTIFLVGFRDSRELWWVPTSKLRLVDNVTLGRPPREAT